MVYELCVCVLCVACECVCVCVCVHKKGMKKHSNFNKRSAGFRMHWKANVKYLFKTYLRLGQGKNKQRMLLHPSFYVISPIPNTSHRY